MTNKTNLNEEKTPLNVSKIEKSIGRNKFDLDYSLTKYKNSKFIWGEGEIRFLIKK